MTHPTGTLNTSQVPLAPHRESFAVLPYSAKPFSYKTDAWHCLEFLLHATTVLHPGYCTKQSLIAVCILQDFGSPEYFHFAVSLDCQYTFVFVHCRVSGLRHSEILNCFLNEIILSFCPSTVFGKLNLGSPFFWSVKLCSHFLSVYSCTLAWWAASQLHNVASLQVDIIAGDTCRFVLS